jgi:nucleotide-binding universal stress UspA family protein
MTSPKVLVAIDKGEAALEALRQARSLAHGLGAELAAVHVLPVVHDLSLLFPEKALSLAADASVEAATARSELEQYVRERLGLELGNVFVERGTPYAEVVRRAEAWNADYLVVGSHGRGGLSRMILGSVAERVVRHAPCSALVARPVAQPGLVLVATDLSPESEAAVDAGAAAARRRGAKLTLMTVVDWTDFGASAWGGLFGPVPSPPSEELRKQVHETAQSILETALGRTGVAGDTLVVPGGAAAQIVQTVEQLQPELVVVGTHGRTGLPRLALGSVAESVIRNAACSVLAVRAGVTRARM